MTRLVSPKTNQKLRLGEPVTFEIASEEEIDSILVESNGNLRVYYQNSFTWEADEMKTGKQKIRMTVYFGEQSESHYPRFTFLSDVPPQPYTYRVVKAYPHNKEAYTQGLFFKDDVLYESTGQKGKSWLGKVDLQTGKAYEKVNINAEYFGEGSTFWQDKIIMLTWTSGTGFVFDESLKQTGTFTYGSEGWGITTFGDKLIMSDGTERLHFLDPRDFSEVGSLEVYDDQGPVKQLNELEMIEGALYANVYGEEHILAIDPNSGKVLKKIDMRGLLGTDSNQGEDVLNGIAYHPQTRKIYVTGKWWPRLFEVQFVPVNPS